MMSKNKALKLTLFISLGLAFLVPFLSLVLYSAYRGEVPEGLSWLVRFMGVVFVGAVLSAVVSHQVLKGRAYKGTETPAWLMRLGWVPLDGDERVAYFEGFAYQRIGGMHVASSVGEDGDGSRVHVDSKPVFFQFSAGRWRWADEAYRGVYGGRGALALRNFYAFRQGWTGVFSGRRGVDERYPANSFPLPFASVVAVRLDEHYPFLLLMPDMGKSAKTVTRVSDVVTESVDFNARWMVDTGREGQESRYVHAFLNPRVMGYLLEGDRDHLGHIVLDGEWLVSVAHSDVHNPQVVEERLAYLNGLADMMPDFISTKRWA